MWDPNCIKHRTQEILKLIPKWASEYAASLDAIFLPFWPQVRPKLISKIFWMPHTFLLALENPWKLICMPTLHQLGPRLRLPLGQILHQNEWVINVMIWIEYMYENTCKHEYQYIYIHKCLSYSIWFSLDAGINHPRHRGRAGGEGRSPYISTATPVRKQRGVLDKGAKPELLPNF